MEKLSKDLDSKEKKSKFKTFILVMLFGIPSLVFFILGIIAYYGKDFSKAKTYFVIVVVFIIFIVVWKLMPHKTKNWLKNQITILEEYQSELNKKI